MAASSIWPDQQRPEFPLPAGEVCAFSPTATGGGARGDGRPPRLLYGRVTADARPAAGQPLHRIPLEVSHHEKANTCTHIALQPRMQKWSCRVLQWLWGGVLRISSPQLTGELGTAGGARQVRRAAVDPRLVLWDQRRHHVLRW